MPVLLLVREEGSILVDSLHGRKKTNARNPWRLGALRRPWLFRSGVMVPHEPEAIGAFGPAAQWLDTFGSMDGDMAR